MSETQESQESLDGMSLGIGSDLNVKNTTPFNPGIQKGYLSEVKQEQIGKKEEKYDVLVFIFKDLAGDRTYRHTEFPVKSDDAKRDVKLQGLNKRIGHIYTEFTPMPKEGLGMGAKNFKDLFTKIADAFNTGNNGKPIYMREESEKKLPIITWLKLTVDGKNNIGFPLSPNFIERVKENNVNEARTLVIDKKFDKMEQTDKAQATTGVMGGAPGAIAAKDDFNF